MRIVWDDQTAIDLDEIWNYIAKDNVRYADSVFARLRSGVAQLEQFPRIGRAGRVADTRELVYPDLPYIAIYSLDSADDAVLVLRFVHAARYYPPNGGS